MSQTDQSKTDMAAIEALHRQDIAASKANNFKTLRSLLSEEAVLIPPGGTPVQDQAILDASFQSMQEIASQVEVLDYVQEFAEIQVLGEYAFEWGTIRGSARHKESGEIEHSAYNVMRILRRQPDGAWKVHRSIWNDRPVEA